MSAEVFRLIAKPFLPLANGGSTRGGNPPRAFSAPPLSAPQVVARGAAEPDHSVSPYLTRPLRSEIECLLKRYREGGKRNA